MGSVFVPGQKREIIASALEVRCLVTVNNLREGRVLEEGIIDTIHALTLM